MTLAARTMYELVLRAPQHLVEPVSDTLIDELDAQSVSVEDADAGRDDEQALFGEPGLPAPAQGWQRSALKALFETEAAARQAATALLAAQGPPDGEGGLELVTLAPLAEQDWVRLTQSQFAPVAITPEFWVVPSWHVAPAAARQVIRLDPGLAFGTGTHPTTRMCLRWLAQHAKAPGGLVRQRVLDYGCGSGILAIAAALLGAAEVTAVDIDPAALQASQDNARDNGVSLSIGTPEAAQGSFDLVLANILAAPLKLLAPMLATKLALGGWLVMAGILDRQASELCEAYSPWLRLAVADREDGWALMTACRES